MAKTRRKMCRILSPLILSFSLFPAASSVLFALAESPKWTFQGEASFSASPAAGWNGVIYAGSEDYRIYALSPDNGDEIWSLATDDWIQSSPAVAADGTIYVGSWDFFLYALSPEGHLLWWFETDNFIYSSPAVGPNGNIYFGSADTFLYCVDPAGNLRWVFPTGDWIDSSPAIGNDGTVYFGSWDGFFYAVNDQGLREWEYYTGEILVSSPALDRAGRVYFGAGNHLLALDTNPELSEEERLLWSFETGGLVDSSPAIGSDGTVYFGSGDGRLYAVGPDGTEAWTYQTGDGIFSSPAVAEDGSVFVGSGDGFLHAVDSSGSLIRKFETDDWVDAAPLLTSGGDLYFSSFDGTLYAYSGAGDPAHSDWPQFRADPRRSGIEPMDFRRWLEFQGSNPESASPSEDSFGDGMPNLVRYAFELPIREEPGRTYPELLHRTDGTVEYRFPIDRRKRDLEFEPQVSENLVSWEQSGYQIEEGPEAVVHGTVTMPDSEAPSRFFRLNIILKQPLSP
jgi:outer membrane protein assembly factor BamB